MKRAKDRPSDLSQKECAALSSSSLNARLVYLIAIRPYANRKGVVKTSEDEIAERLSGMYDESGLSLALVREALDRLQSDGRITQQYSERAYRVIVMAGVH